MRVGVVRVRVGVVRVVRVRVGQEGRGGRGGAWGADGDLAFLALASPSVSETLGEWVVVDLELGDAFILVGSDRNEFGLLEHVGSEGSPSEIFIYFVSANQVKAGLILVHRVEHCESFVVDVVG